MSEIEYELFSLFKCAEEGRLVIAPAEDKNYRHCYCEQGTYAESWLDAKQRLGFELTATQRWLLDARKRSAA